jgi:cell division protein FtsL
MSDKSKSEIIIDVESPGNEKERRSDENTGPGKKLSFQTKFFFGIFAVILIYHLISSWSSGRQISDLNEKLTDANKQISSFELKNQALELKVSQFTTNLHEAKSNLKYVETARQVSIEEGKKLTDVLAGFKKNLNEGSKLEIARLEQKLAEWEVFQKSVEDILKKRPAVIAK